MRIQILARLALLGLASAGALATAQEIGGCKIYPPAHIWNTRVDRLPLHPLSDIWIATVGSDRTLRADFGSGLFNGGPIGIPFLTIPGNQPRVPVSFEFNSESDPGPYPIPPDAPIEGGAQSSGDRHILLVDRDACRLYEIYAAYQGADGAWRAGSGAIFDLNSYSLRPKGWTSADAAGLPILPGLVRYDEVASGEIRHALRFTVPQTQRAYVWPARHFASRLTEPKYPPMGAWFRLRAGMDLTRFSTETQVILRALQRYGMILADNGSSWYISGAPDERWRNDRLRELLTIRGSDLEAVDVSSLQIGEDSAQARQDMHPPAVRNAASGEAGPVSPGEIVSIFGTGLGPREGLAAGGAALPAELGGTSVRIGEEKAALLYASEAQVNAIVPYGLAGAAPLVVTYGGAEVLRVNVAMAPTAPAVFVYADSLAVSWNQDGSTGATARGSILSLLATGEGATTRPELYGRIVEGELPRPLAPVRAWIAGVEAEVLYAGGAPGLRAGVLQINVRIPDRAPVGLQAITIRAGNYVSPPGPRILVR